MLIIVTFALMLVIDEGKFRGLRQRRRCETRSNELLERLLSRVPGRRAKPEHLESRVIAQPLRRTRAGAAHSRGCASGNTLAPTKRGITFPSVTPPFEEMLEW
jgi:hypothetical protein